jgi:Ca-activated chloride channel family protein
MPAPKTAWYLDSTEAIATRVAVYSPARVNLAERTTYLQGSGRVVVTAASPEVRVRNREVPHPGGYREPNVTTAATAGEYFVGLQPDPAQYDLSGRVMQVRLSLAIDGKVTGQPEYTTSTTPSPSPNPTATLDSPAPTGQPTVAPDSVPPSSSPRRGLVLAGAGVLAVALVGGALWWSRRKGASRNPVE